MKDILQISLLLIFTITGCRQCPNVRNAQGSNVELEQKKEDCPEDDEISNGSEAAMEQSECTQLQQDISPTLIEFAENQLERQPEDSLNIELNSDGENVFVTIKNYGEGETSIPIDNRLKISRNTICGVNLEIKRKDNSFVKSRDSRITCYLAPIQYFLLKAQTSVGSITPWEEIVESYEVSRGETYLWRVIYRKANIKERDNRKVFCGPIESEWVEMKVPGEKVVPATGR